MDKCAKCGCPVEVRVLTAVGLVPLCYCCVEMWLSVASNPFFIKAQQEYDEETERRKRILNGD